MVLQPRERLERLEKVLAELNETNAAGAPVLVEGRRDLESLRAVGVTGDVVILHQGKQLFALCEHLAASHRLVIVLTDDDAKGRRLAKEVDRILALNGGQADHRFRHDLFRLVDGHDVESLAGFLSRLRDVAQRRRP